jgi:hypothetical protein
MKNGNILYSKISLYFSQKLCFNKLTFTQRLKENSMSNYTPTMIAEMQSTGSFTYDSALAFAEAHSLSVRSVISKVKHLGLDYTPKPKTVSSAGPRVAKSEIVNAIAKALDTDADMIAGLAKADARALSALLMAIR